MTDTPQMAEREYYIDRLRVVLTAMVIVFHSAITYGGAGSWFYQEQAASSRPDSVLLTFLNTTLQAFFMGFFFLLAGYFTPASLRRKGYRRFLTDRLVRLGIPLLFFGLVLAPLTVGVAGVAQGVGFWPPVLALWKSRKFVNGPLWFAEALLVFDLTYCLWHFLTGSARSSKMQPDSPAEDRMPGQGAWWLSMICTGVAALLIRQIFPLDARFFGVWPAFFAAYIFLFAVGVRAGRGGWLKQLNWKQARPFVITACVAWPILPFAAAVYYAQGRGTHAVHGLAWPNVLLAFWEPCIAWGVIPAMLLVFRNRFNHPSLLWKWLGRRAYAVYILHSTVLVVVSLLLRGVNLPMLVKFVTAAAMTITLTWLVTDPLVRMPGVRRVV